MLRKKMLYESVIDGVIKMRCYIMYRISPARIMDYVEEPENDDCFGVTAHGLFWKDDSEFPEPYSFEFSSDNDDICMDEFISEYRHAFYVASRMKARYTIRFVIDSANSVFTVDVESVDDKWGL